MIAKIKELEKLFRDSINDANNGALQQFKIPYKSTNLPLEKINRICTKHLSKWNGKISEINTTFYKEMQEATDEVMKCIRISGIQSEKEQLNQQEIITETNHISVENNMDVQPNMSDEDSSEVGTDEEYID